MFPPAVHPEQHLALMQCTTVSNTPCCSTRVYIPYIPCVLTPCRRTALFAKAHKIDLRPGGSPTMPLVSKVRPLMEEGRGQDSEERSPFDSSLEEQK